MFVKNKLLFFIVMILSTLIMNKVFAIENLDFNKRKAAEIAYSNFSTAPSYIDVTVQDGRTLETKKLILENIDFSDFISKQKEFSKAKEYIKYMLDNYNKTIVVDYELFKEHMFKRNIRKYGSEKHAKKHADPYTYEKTLSLKEVGCNSWVEFIEKYFNYNEGHGVLKTDMKKMPLNPYKPEFIAVLINLGFVVSRGDIAPVLLISKP